MPKGRPFYRFPLTQGSEGSELEYMVYLNSPDFPLDSDIEYNLELSYTYGDDDPYELQFIPYKTHHQGMQTVKAEWRQFRDIFASFSAKI